MTRRIIVAITGAAGAVYGVRLLEELQKDAGIETHLIVSRAGFLNVTTELGMRRSELETLAEVVHSDRDIGASIASGSFKTDGMMVTPCSMKTLSGIVNSYADNLLCRAADVMLKERKRLILVPRESPLHSGHCRLLYEAAKMGIDIAPPMPAFYNRPESVDDIVNHTVGRILDLIGLDSGLVKRWSGVGEN